jgi:hypothetical protein
MNNPPLREPMRQEWEAWQTVVREWPGDINDPRYTRLVKAIQRWGEWLALLRVEQSPEIRQQAIRMAEAAYEKAKDTHPALGGHQPACSEDRQKG